MRTKRGGYVARKQKAPRVKLRGAVMAGGGDVVIVLATVDELTGWRRFGPRRPIEPLDAGLKRYLWAL